MERAVPVRPSFRHVRAAVAAAAVAIAAACDAGRSATAAPAVRAGDAEQVAFGVRHNLATAGVRRGALRADSALFFDGGTRIELRGVRLTLFAPSGDSVAWATSRAATYALPLRRVTLHGGVSVRARDGRQLVAARVTYDAASARLSGDSAYTLTGGGGPATGVGFDADAGLRAVRPGARPR